MRRIPIRRFSAARTQSLGTRQVARVGAATGVLTLITLTGAATAVQAAPTANRPAPAAAPTTFTAATFGGPRIVELPAVQHVRPRLKPRVRHLIVRLVVRGNPRAIGRALAAERGWTGAQWVCLDRLWTRESGWQVHEGNSAGAYGIPQALPGRKMAAAGSDWRDNPRTQIRWGLGYIASRYASPCAAWRHSQAHNYY